MIERETIGDAAEPRSKRCFRGFEALDVVDGSQECVLREFLGVGGVGRETCDELEEAWRIAAQELFLCRRISSTEAFCQLMYRIR